MALIRRAMMAVGVAAAVATAIRIRASGDSPTRVGGWRQLTGPDLR